MVRRLATLLSVMGVLGACQESKTFGPSGDEARYTVTRDLPAPGLMLQGDAIPLPASIVRHPVIEDATAYVCPAPHILYLNFNGGTLAGSSNCSDATANPPCSFIVNNGSGSVNFPAFSGSSSA